MKTKTLFKSLAIFLLGLSCTSFSLPIKNSNDVEKNNIKFANELDVSEDEFGKLNEDLSFEIRSVAKTPLTTSVEVLINQRDSMGNYIGDPNSNYYVGNRGKGDEYLPSSLAFKVRTSNGDIEDRVQEVNKYYQTNSYDGIGNSLGGESISTYCDIPLAYGEELLLDEEIILFNIFNYDSETKTVDFNDKSYLVGTTDRINTTTYKSVYDINDFLEINYVGSSDYSGFAAFEFNVINKGAELYGSLSSTTARAERQYKSQLEDGTYYIKSDFSFGGGTKFKLTMKDGSVQELASIAKNHEITKGGNIILTFENVKASDVLDVTIFNISYKLSIFNVDGGKSLARTNFTQRFGDVYTGMSDLKDTNGVVKVNKVTDTYYIDQNLTVILMFSISSFLFFGTVIPAYFYLKKKNRNDEFKRMNTKSYVTTASMGYVCIESVLMCLTFITIRATSFANSLAVFNPTDAYIIVLGVIAIITVGYFIRYFAIMTKNHIEKSKREKLKLNQDVIDDGTLIIK